MASPDGKVEYWKAHGVVYGPMYLGSSIPDHVRDADPLGVYVYSTCRKERSACVAVLVRQIFFVLSVVLSIAAMLAARRKSRRAALFGGVCSAWAAIACSVVWVLYLLSSTHSEYNKIEGMCQSLPDKAVGILFPEVFASSPGRCTFISLFVCAWLAILATAVHMIAAVKMSLRFYKLTSATMLADKGATLTDDDEEDMEYRLNMKQNRER